MKRVAGMGFIANPGLNDFAGISPPNQRYQQPQLEEDFQNVPTITTLNEQRAL